MAESTARSDRGAGAVGLDRPALARARPLGRAAADGRRGRGDRADVEPDDLPEGDRRRRRLRRADPRAASRRPTIRARSSSRSRSRTSATPATCSGRSGTRRAASTATSRSRSIPGSPSTRRRRSSRRSTCTAGSSGRTSTSRSRRHGEGLPAIEDCIAARHLDQRHADLLARALPRRSSPPTCAALARLVADGGDPSKVTSVASFFVSRLDTEADARLEELGNDELAGQARDREREARLQALRARPSPGRPGTRSPQAGANVQRPLWASTSTKNPAYRDVMYVEELIGPDTVNTMPLETLEAFADHGEVRGDTVLEGVDEAEQLLAELAEAGVDYDDVVAHARGRGRAEVRRLLRRADRRHRGQARRAGGDVTTERRELVARIWSRDPTVWTGKDEARWLGWLDEPSRMRDDVEPLLRLAEDVVGDVDAVVLLGMGGSSLAPGGAAPRLRQRGLPRPRHDASAGDPRARRRGSTSSGRSSSRPRSRARRSRRARTPTTSGSSRRGASSGSRSPTPARRSPRSRASARSRPSFPASRRSAAATRRSRRSGSSRPR